MRGFNGLLGLCLAPAVLVATSALAGSLTLERVLDRAFAPTVDIVAVPGTTDRSFLVNLITGAVDIFDRSNGSVTEFLGPVSVDGVALSDTPFAANAYAIAPAPDFESSGRFFLSVNTADKRNVVLEYQARGSDLAGDTTVDQSTARKILTIEHPVGGGPETHYGGAIRFGPDGMLYVTTGDSDWPIDNPAANPSQNVGDRLGAVLRIDPRGDDFPGDDGNNYAVPAGNPDFGAGADPALFAIGARNPFKATFDPASGYLFVADVGEVQGDEITAIATPASGAPNLGWPAFEGSSPLSPEILPLTGDLLAPILDIPQGTGPFEGFSLTGGVFYDGPIAELDGRYVFGDFGPGFDPTFTSPIWSVAFDATAMTASDWRRWSPVIAGGGSLGPVIGFGLDGGGGLFVSTINLATLSGEVFLVTGAAAPSPVPLPAGLGLLLAAVGGLVTLGRARRSRH